MNCGGLKPTCSYNAYVFVKSFCYCVFLPSLFLLSLAGKMKILAQLSCPSLSPGFSVPSLSGEFSQPPFSSASGFCDSLTVTQGSSIPYMHRQSSYHHHHDDVYSLIRLWAGNSLELELFLEVSQHQWPQAQKSTPLIKQTTHEEFRTQFLCALEKEQQEKLLSSDQSLRNIWKSFKGNDSHPSIY